VTVHSSTLFSLVARNHVDRIRGIDNDRAVDTPRPFVLEDAEPEPLSLLMARDVAIPEPIVGDGILYPGTVTVLGGASKVRKTWTVKDLSLSLASGQNFLIHSVPRPVPVLYLGAEGLEWKLKRDFSSAASYKLGITDEDLDRVWVLATLGRIKIDTEAGEEWLQDRAKMFDVIILDPYYRFLSRGSENDHADQRRVQDVLDRLKAKGKAIVLVHHVRKPTGEDHGIAELRGAGLDNYLDAALILKRKVTPTSDKTTLHYTLRNAPPLDPIELKIEPETGPLLVPAGTPNRIVTVADVVGVLREAGGRIEGREALIEALRRRTGASDTSARRGITESEETGRVWSKKREDDKRGRVYVIKGRPENE
jgi:hypothetical protein